MSSTGLNSKSDTFTHLPVVITSMSRWDGDYSSASWSLAKVISQKQPVLYIDYPFTFADFLREGRKDQVRKRYPALLFGKKSTTHRPEFGPMLYTLAPKLMLPVNWLPDGRVYRKLKTTNDQRLVKFIHQSLNELGYSDFIFLNCFNPIYLTSLPKGFSPRLFLYQSQDKLSALGPYLEKYAAKAEIDAIKQADLSFATSSRLQRELTQESGREVRLLPNAVDFELFNKAYTQKLPIPEDIKNIPPPRIGYTGNICSRVDYDIIEHICRTHPDKNVVMVGPRNHKGQTTIDLDAIPNLYFTGSKNISELPAYLAAFDSLILPFRINDLTKSIYPLKINEYLASGKPIVATPFSKDIESFSDVIELAKGPESFSKAITKSMEQNSEKKSQIRVKRASENTWQKRVDLLRSWIEEFELQESSKTSEAARLRFP